MGKSTYRVVLAADNAGYEYKEQLKKDLAAHPAVNQIIDLGVESKESNTAYPIVAVAAAEKIAANEADRGLLICGTGLGVAIAANKVRGIRAVTAHDSFSVERAIKSNNAQVLTLGQRVIGLELARKLVNEWLSHDFDEESPSADKIAVLTEYENKNN